MPFHYSEQYIHIPKLFFLVTLHIPKFFFLGQKHIPKLKLDNNYQNEMGFG